MARRQGNRSDMFDFGKQAKARLDAFCCKIDQQRVGKLRFPPFYPTDSDGSGCIYISTKLIYKSPTFNEAVAVNHYILDHLTRTMAKTPKVLVSVHEMDEDVAIRLSSYLANPASGVEQLFVESAPFGIQSRTIDAVTKQVLLNGILRSTALQEASFCDVAVAENDLAALCNSTSLRRLCLDRVVIRPAEKKCPISAQPSVTTLKELTFDVTSDESKKGSACIARLVRRLASSGGLEKVTLLEFDHQLPSYVFTSLAKVHTVVFENCSLAKNQMEELAIGLGKFGRTKSLSFTSCDFSRRAKHFLGKVVERVQGLESVEISAVNGHAAETGRCTMSSIEWKGRTSNGLQFVNTNCSLVSLRLDAFLSFHGSRALPILWRNLKCNQSLRSLHISEMYLFDPVAECIRENSSLQELTLQDCDLSEPSFISLLEAITVNTTILKLCIKKCLHRRYVDGKPVPWETILPQMKTVYQLHLDMGQMPDEVLEKIVGGIEGNHSLLKFSAEWRSGREEEFQEKADEYTTRNLRSHATLVLTGPSGAQCLPRVVIALSSHATGELLVFEVLAQHCDLFCDPHLIQYEHSSQKSVVWPYAICLFCVLLCWQQHHAPHLDTAEP